MLRCLNVTSHLQGTVTEKKIARIIRSILRFIAQCHAKGVIYRDVKPDNFLFLSKDDNSPLRATDFGLSIRYVARLSKLAASCAAWAGLHMETHARIPL